METAKAVALAGDAALCAEPMSGQVTQVADGFKNTAIFGSHEFIIDEPIGFGGTNTAANPAEIMMGAIAASIAVTLRGHAALMDIPVGAVIIKIGGALDIRGFFDVEDHVRSGFPQIDIDVRVETSASADALNVLLKRVLRSCPVLDNVQNPTEISVKLSAATA